MIYTLPEKKYWTGRIDSHDERDSSRIHQEIKLGDIQTKQQNENAFGIIGFECDEGVRRNKGRTGAALAPNTIRKSLSGLPYHFDKQIFDFGNIVCQNKALELAQNELGDYVREIYEKSCTPIILGGGHETLYGHYLGARNFVGKDASLGIINIDAHFDLRDDEIPSSGTMFKQILDRDPNAGYLCIGIQEFGNTASLFNTADKLGCIYIMEEDVEANNFKDTFHRINQFTDQYDHIILTLCTDSVVSYAAPGVSAPSPFGLDPKAVKTLINYIVMKENVLSFDISEVNPKYDVDGRTTRLAAYLLAEVMKNFHKNKK